MTSPTESRNFIVADDDDGIRLDRWFKRNLADVSFNQVSRWARTGQIRIDGKRATPGDRVALGQALRDLDFAIEPSAMSVDGILEALWL